MEGEVLTAVLAAISQVGFPIAVATYSLVVLNKTIQRNTAIMSRICARLDIDENSD